MMDAVGRAALSGAGSGGVLGLGSAILGGAGIKSALRRAVLGSLMGGGAAATAVGAGSLALGSPDAGESNPYTRRGAAGGAITGGTFGALLGGAMSKGILSGSLAKKYLKVPEALGGMARFAAGKHPALSAIIGGLSGGAVGAYQGGDEGMQVDFIQNEIADAQKKRRRERALA